MVNDYVKYNRILKKTRSYIKSAHICKRENYHCLMLVCFPRNEQCECVIVTVHTVNSNILIFGFL